MEQNLEVTTGWLKTVGEHHGEMRAILRCQETRTTNVELPAQHHILLFKGMAFYWSWQR
jgi:hypothetical protein